MNGGLPNTDYSVVTCFIEYEGKVLLLKRNKKDLQFGLWGIPGGKLDGSESPKEGLAREIEEELGLSINQNSFTLLGSSPMRNDCDGSYLLYLFHAALETLPEIKINLKEHSEYTWTSLKDFKKYPLLICQGAAFDLVKENLYSVIKKNEEQLCLINQN